MGPAAARGTLRVYLGASSGVGTTCAMLAEGRRRLERGTDVVLAVVDDHGRPHTRAAARGLERVGDAGRLDVPAVLRRSPQVALVDELAHAGSGPPRWQGVEALLDAGIDVVTTVRVEQLESLYDVVEAVIGVPPAETVPDAVVRGADQVELVDMSPQALRRRVAHGNVHAPEDVDAALGSRFRVGTLAALREMSLRWLADRVAEGLQVYRHDHGIDRAWEVRERVVVALTGGAEGDTLVRRAARIATRQRGDLLAVHVARRERLPGAPPGALATQRGLVERLGGSFHVVVGDDVPAALLAFARAESATQLVLGTSRRGRLAQLRAPGTGARAVRGSGTIDVHLVPHEASGTGGARLPAGSGGITPRRRLLGALTALVSLPLLTLVLVAARDRLALGSQLLLYLAVVVLVALVGGTWPALASAVAAALLGNWYFTRPFQTLRVADGDDLVSLLVFVLVAVAVSAVVDVAARRTREAARSRAESEAMAALSGDVLRGERTLPALLNRARELLGLQAVRLLETVDGVEQVVGASGTAGDGAPVTVVPVADGVRLELRGRPVAADELRVLGAFAAQAAVSVERGRLRAQARAAELLGEVDRVRTALLAAVGHDLHTPLAAAKASVGSLRATDVAWTPAETAELLATAEESLDQLTALVSNLLDLSRLQAGVLGVHPQRCSPAEVLPAAAMDQLGPALVLDLPEDLPDVLVDPGLLERVLANLLQNAARHAPPGTPVRLSGSRLADRLELRVVDRGPGVADADKERVFAPFQRLGDRSSSAYGAGVGLGLAVSRGFVEAMGGTLSAEDTPGGGLTMTVVLPVAAG